MINDWIDFIGVCGLNFLVIVIGVWVLPQIPQKTHFVFAISILLSSIFFTRKIIEFLIKCFNRRIIKRLGSGGKK
jgi:hypothetical protein